MFKLHYYCTDIVGSIDERADSWGDVSLPMLSSSIFDFAPPVGNHWQAFVMHIPTDVIVLKLVKDGELFSFYSSIGSVGLNGVTTWTRNGVSVQVVSTWPAVGCIRWDSMLEDVMSELYERNEIPQVPRIYVYHKIKDIIAKLRMWSRKSKSLQPTATQTEQTPPMTVFELRFIAALYYGSSIQLASDVRDVIRVYLQDSNPNTSDVYTKERGLTFWTQTMSYLSTQLLRFNAKQSVTFFKDGVWYNGSVVTCNVPIRRNCHSVDCSDTVTLMTQNIPDEIICFSYLLNCARGDAVLTLDDASHIRATDASPQSTEQNSDFALLHSTSPNRAKKKRNKPRRKKKSQSENNHAKDTIHSDNTVLITNYLTKSNLMLPLSLLGKSAALRVFHFLHFCTNFKSRCVSAVSSKIADWIRTHGHLNSCLRVPKNEPGGVFRMFFKLLWFVYRISANAIRRHYLSYASSKQRSKLNNLDLLRTANDACVVCLDAISNHIYIPCGHRCICQRCAGMWGAKSSTCPFCNVEGKAYRVYDVA